MIMSRCICVAASGVIPFFFTPEPYSVVFKSHSSVDRPLGCFLVLAIVNSVAMHKGCVDLLELLFCLDIRPGVGLP